MRDCFGNHPNTGGFPCMLCEDLKKCRIESGENVHLEFLDNAILTAINHVGNLECGCDSYNGYTCPIHRWKAELEHIREEISRAMESE